MTPGAAGVTPATPFSPDGDLVQLLLGPVAVTLGAIGGV
jgi:hypothetical protein